MQTSDKCPGRTMVDLYYSGVFNKAAHRCTFAMEATNIYQTAPGGILIPVSFLHSRSTNSLATNLNCILEHGG